jgi:hypothetical protein
MGLVHFRIYQYGRATLLVTTASTFFGAAGLWRQIYCRQLTAAELHLQLQAQCSKQVNGN